MGSAPARNGKRGARPDGRPHRPANISGANRDWVLAEVERSPHVTIAVLSAGLAARGLTIHPASVARFLHREGKSFKRMARPACKGFLSSFSVCANVSGLEVVPRPRWSFRAYRSS
jgi:transposase